MWSQESYGIGVKAGFDRGYLWRIHACGEHEGRLDCAGLRICWSKAGAFLDCVLMRMFGYVRELSDLVVSVRGREGVVVQTKTMVLPPWQARETSCFGGLKFMATQRIGTDLLRCTDSWQAQCFGLIGAHLRA